MSALDGSNWLLKLIVAGLPSLTGPLFESVAVGLTLFTVTVLVYSVNPLSLSMTRPLTVNEPLSLNAQDVVALAPEFPYVAEASEPLSHAYA